MIETIDNDFDEIIFNDLDDRVQYKTKEEFFELYAHYFLMDPSWEQSSFKVIDLWDWDNWPHLLARYEIQNQYEHKSFNLYLEFADEHYKVINKIKLNIIKYDDDGGFIGSRVLEIENLNLSKNYFFILDGNGNILSGTEEKCIRLINKYWNLRAFS